jgi:hypothetical protein
MQIERAWTRVDASQRAAYHGDAAAMMRPCTAEHAAFAGIVAAQYGQSPDEARAAAKNGTIQ